jgi:hypothetical protein
MTSKERKLRAIRKAVRTRAANRAAWKRYFEVDAPARKRLDNLLNYFLRKFPVSVRFNPRDSGLRLRHGVTQGRLIAVDGMSVIVQPEGYKRPRGYHFGFWEVLLP